MSLNKLPEWFLTGEEVFYSYSSVLSEILDQNKEALKTQELIILILLARSLIIDLHKKSLNEDYATSGILKSTGISVIKEKNNNWNYLNGLFTILRDLIIKIKADLDFWKKVVDPKVSSPDHKSLPQHSATAPQ